MYWNLITSIVKYVHQSLMILILIKSKEQFQVKWIIKYMPNVFITNQDQLKLLINQY